MGDVSSSWYRREGFICDFSNSPSLPLDLLSDLERFAHDSLTKLQESTTIVMNSIEGLLDEPAEDTSLPFSSLTLDTYDLNTSITITPERIRQLCEQAIPTDNLTSTSSLSKAQSIIHSLDLSLQHSDINTTLHITELSQPTEDRSIECVTQQQDATTSTDASSPLPHLPLPHRVNLLASEAARVRRLREKYAKELAILSLQERGTIRSDMHHELRTNRIAWLRASLKELETRSANVTSTE
ncbi:hypothetical protein GMRT_16278 [Giardia muris]|uniref:Uncharacterized protein n=1 Tax=Giardia muris TaxID=5742 RepID=A0A4Z1SUY5_GIAMU|nr:hypothetical protein GMRT_16278 [Giardia muris]|eukprot:TNJ29624.1 hypothetical protein GMRT_16278 [Giardia muris]